MDSFNKILKSGELPIITFFYLDTGLNLFCFQMGMIWS